MMKKLAHRLLQLDPTDEFRIRVTEQLLEKTCAPTKTERSDSGRYAMGLIPIKKSLAQIADITASAFCRRRLSVILVRNKYCESLKQACTYIEQGM